MMLVYILASWGVEFADRTTGVVRRAAIGVFPNEEVARARFLSLVGDHDRAGLNLFLRGVQLPGEPSGLFPLRDDRAWISYEVVDHDSFERILASWRQGQSFKPKRVLE